MNIKNESLTVEVINATTGVTTPVVLERDAHVSDIRQALRLPSQYELLKADGFTQLSAQQPIRDQVADTDIARIYSSLPTSVGEVRDE